MKSFKKVCKWVDCVERTVLVWTILGLACVGFVQVITRYLFDFSFSWYEELGRYLGVFITFLGAAVGVKSGNHFAMDSVIRNLDRSWQALIRCLTSLFSALFCFVVVYYSWKIVVRMHGYGTTTPAMQIPKYWAYLPIPFFSCIMGVRFLMHAVRHGALFTGRRGGTQAPETRKSEVDSPAGGAQ